MQQITVEEETIRTLLSIVQGGPGEPTPAMRDEAINDALGALRRGGLPQGECAGQLSLF